MTVSVQDTIFYHVGNGVTTVFAYNCQVLQSNDLYVYVDGLEITSGITKNGIGSASGGTVTFAVAPVSGASVILEREVALERTTDYQQNGDFLARVVNPDFNRIWMALQQLFSNVRRSLRVPKSDINPITELPNSAARADKLLGFDSSGNPVAVAPVSGSAGALAMSLASSIGASMLGFLQTGVGAVLQTIYNKLMEFPSAGDFGAVVGTSIDNSPKIAAALLAHDHVRILKPGFYRCDSMIEINTGKTLELGAGVFLKRYSANSASTDPVVWIKGSNAALIGAGHGSSSVFSQNRAPAGVVSLGHRDMTQSHGNVLYSTLRGILMGGGVDYGQTSGAPDIALFMCNPQIGGLASYFHNVSDICVQDVNIGVALYGEANANTIRGIQGVRIGNVTHPTPTRNAMFINAGATDNNVSGAFFHQSPNTRGLVVDNYDNTATPGGSNHIQQANTWLGITFEQGGVSALGLHAIVGTGACHYDIMSNCAGGDSLAAGFHDNNWRIAYGTSKNSFLAEAATQKTFYGVNTAGLAVTQRKYLRLSGLTENTTYKVVTMTMPSNTNAVLVKIQFAVGAGAGLDFQGAGEVTYEVKRNSAGVVSATSIRSRYTGLCRPCIPEISGTDCILKFAVFNNGTASSVTSLFAEVAITGTVTPTYFETPTTGAAGTVLPATLAVKGTTAARPTLIASDAGHLYFDTTLDADGKPIWWTGTAWVDGLGAVV